MQAFDKVMDKILQALDTVTDNHMQERHEEERREDREEREVISILL